ncbi:MAG: hypothetical protein DPW09_01460 [Anaerolineae bacterium]|nr:hypothetical protein [Anaerolineae bacterium]
MFTISRTLPITLKPKSLHVVPDASRCMQCGICSFNCPAGIDVRAYAWRGLPVDDSACLTCGECVRRCPRRGLQLEPMKLPGKNKA